MRQSQLFTKTRKEAPKDEVSKNAQLLIRAGYIHKEMAGVYTLLPLGLRVANNISNIIREEMNAIGGQELLMTVLQDKTLWEKTDRWDDAKVDNWFKTTLKNGTEVGLGLSHEEELTNILSEYVNSYRDLPLFAYQIQTKFRNEARAKSGIMRGREFVMKDMYSFSRNEKEHTEMYAKAREAYFRVFRRAGIGDRTHVVFASGGIFSKFSEEFQTESDAGEDLIYVDEKKGVAVNKEVLTDDVLSDLGVKRADLVEKKTIEVGNIFNLGTKFSEPLGLSYVNEKGEKAQVIMGCYGIGIGRLMGTIVETLSDKDGIVWPEEVAPFKLHLISLGKPGSDAEKRALGLYEELAKKGIEVLFDDRDARPGEKFADSDLIGIPVRAVISEKTMAAGGKLEIKERKSGAVSMVTKDELMARFN